MIKRIITACVLAFALLLCCTAAAADGNAENSGGLVIAVASDLHYISPEINDNGEYFTHMMSEADGKLTVYCDEITDAFFDEIISLKPDVLLLTGDLSFNGALPSHERLAEKLALVEAAGIRVLVTTGNHDVYYPYAASFSGSSYTLLDETTAEQFRSVYAAFGYDEALSRDTASLSYTALLDPSTALLVFDTNAEGMECRLSEESLEWAEEQLETLTGSGIRVIAVGHQNLLRHSMFTYGYVIEEADRLKTMFEKYGVELMLSGHMHIQHTLTENGVTEIASSSLTVTPCQYGILTLRENGWDYELRRTDVAAWAEKNGSTDENLLNFRQYADDYMDAITARLCAAQLSDCDLTEEEKERMTEYMCAVNRMYFAGDLSGLSELDPDGSVRNLWLESGTMFGTYLLSMSM